MCRSCVALYLYISYFLHFLRSFCIFAVQSSKIGYNGISRAIEEYLYAWRPIKMPFSTLKVVDICSNFSWFCTFWVHFSGKIYSSITFYFLHETFQIFFSCSEIPYIWIITWSCSKGRQKNLFHLSPTVLVTPNK